MNPSTSNISEISKKENQHQSKTDILSVVKKFMKNMKKFFREAKTPNWKEFKDIFRGHLFGLIVLGLFAYAIKLVHILINNMIAGNESK